MLRFAITALLAATLSAATLPQLIESARQKHPALAAIKLRIAAADYAIQRSKNFDDPVVSLGINDIRVDDPTNRSLERMQTNSLSFSQKIPWFGKRDAKEAIEEAAKSLLFASYKEAQARLFAKIKESAYRYWETKKLIEVTKATMALTKQNIELFEAYTASGDSGNSHMGIISAELVKSRLKTSLKRLEAKKEEILALLEYLSFKDLENLEVDLPNRELPPLEKVLGNITQSPSLTIEKAKERVEEHMLELKKLQNEPDPILKVGYYNRSSFEDYLSVGLALSLPIYGTQKSKEEEQRANLLSQKQRVLDKKREIEAKVEALFAKAKSRYEVVRIIERESLPQVNHMFDLIRSDIAAGGDLYKFVDLVEQKLKLDAEAISARAQYYMTIAKIEEILGEKL